MRSSVESAADRAEATLLERWYDLDRGEAEFILDAVARLPDQELLDRPHLLTGAVVARDLVDVHGPEIRGDRSALLQRYSDVVDVATSRLGGERSTPRWLMIRMIAARWKGDLALASELSEKIAHTTTPKSIRSALLDEEEELHRPGQIALQRGLTALLSGHANAAMDLFATAHRASGSPPFRHFAGVNAAANAAMLSAIEGHDLISQKWLDRVGDPETLPSWCRDLITLGATVAAAVLATDILDLGVATQHGDALEHAGDRYELWPFQLYALTGIDLAHNRPVHAYKRFKQIGFERNINIATEPIADHLVFRAYLDTLIAGGEGGLALRLAEDLGTPLRALVPVARTRLLAGDNVGAARVSARAMRRVLIPKRDMWEATVIHAIARMKEGNKSAALRSFEIVLTGAPRLLPAILGRQRTRDVGDIYELSGRQPPTLTLHADPLPSELVALTGSERKVLQYLVDGLNAAQIAAVDVTSEHTVRTHIKNLYRKLRVSSRDQAIALANQRGLVRWHHQDGNAKALI